MPLQETRKKTWQRIEVKEHNSAANNSFLKQNKKTPLVIIIIIITHSPLRSIHTKTNSRKKETTTTAITSTRAIMGCCSSSFLSETHPEKDHKKTQQQQPPRNPSGSAVLDPATGVPSFCEFSFSDLKTATNNFSSDNIVSESGEKAPNLVYKGRLQNRRWIAVKKFTKMAWPDPKQFAVSIKFLALIF